MPSFDLPTRPGRFAVAVPEHWATFDVAHEQLVTARRSAMAGAGSAEERLQIDELFVHAKRVTAAARKAGALWGAGTATVYDDGFFVGQVMLFAVTAPDPATFTTPAMSAALGGGRGVGAADLPPRTVTAVRLADGTAATRVCGQEEVQATDAQRVRVLVSHTFVPVPGTGDEFILVTGLSPNLALEEEVLDLFDAVAGTFRFLPA
jgi:hypothetical protein